MLIIKSDTSTIEVSSMITIKIEPSDDNVLVLLNSNDNDCHIVGFLLHTIDHCVL